MSKKVSATFLEDADYDAALAVANYQDRTMASYIVHCVNIETKKRISSIYPEGALPVQGNGHTA